MLPPDQDYFRLRAEEERQRASQATSANIANIHLELAAKYDELVAIHSLPSDGRDGGGFDPDDPVLQNAVGRRLSAAAARLKAGLEL
ncbi:hypothetical protein [Sphingomonas hankyongi]|uniref:Uncharacterized protein n=1 Tax=Sphingomonas hankyongi TaxID=2908209 RepID=A0ABT0S1P3_9SPHN|nr:hypothetical protein [Sphingomonas hankyongi]MCL6729775.1 hypothetical protein [Sphingomonas hankyongi]